MIDHISISVSDLKVAERFYTALLTPLGLAKCLRVREIAAVDAFHAAALAGGGVSDGAPGLRAKYHENYYAAFIRDPDGNRIEAVTFIAPI
jgi:catechol 2,3-dioxygenase-like lactoylglutathione lyase family enzyme